MKTRDMAHPAYEDWRPPSRWRRAQFLIAFAVQTLALALALLGFYLFIVIVGPAVAA